MKLKLFKHEIGRIHLKANIYLCLGCNIFKYNIKTYYFNDWNNDFKMWDNLTNSRIVLYKKINKWKSYIKVLTNI